MVDEFAALVQEVPEFVDGVVNVAQRGRSLGLHLILATQRPAGVIKDNLRANTNLRVALRMADESDSTDVIDAADAAFIDASHPGRGYRQDRTRANRGVPVRVLRRLVGLDVFGAWHRDPRPWRSSPASHGPDGSSGGAVDEPNDLAQLVVATQHAALVGGHPAPRRPWLTELPADLDLRDAPLTQSDGELVMGTSDLPARQAQPPMSFFPDRDGNLAIFGGSGSGKSTLLRTLAMVAGSMADQPSRGDGPCHVYCIDYGSRQPAAVGGLRTRRRGDQRRRPRTDRPPRPRPATPRRRTPVALRSADADTITQYRERTGSSDARIIVMIDNFGALRQAYDAPARAQVFDTLVSLIADGRSVGVHVVVTADRPGSVPSSIASLIPRRLILRLSNEADYHLAGEPVDVLDKGSPPGRGLEHGNEFQVAVLGGTPDLSEQTRLARALARHPDFGGRAAAPPVRRLPTEVALGELPVAVDGQPTLGLDDATLAPVGFAPHGAFVVAGPPGSGTTTAMATIAVSLGRWEPRFQRVLFADRRSPLLRLDGWTTVAERPAEHAELAAAITNDLAAATGEVAGLALFVENAPELLESAEAGTALADLIKAALSHDVFVVLDGESSVMARAWKLDAVRNQRTGLLLQPQPADGDVLKATLPRTSPDQFPVGRGVLVHRRDLATVQVALPQLDADPAAVATDTDV